MAAPAKGSATPWSNGFFEHQPLAVLLLLLSLIGLIGSLFIPSTPLVGGEGKTPAPGAKKTAELYRHYCLKCHGADGTGKVVRDQHPEIPDFTNAHWQKDRSNVQLRVSILDGKGKIMPPFADKIGEGQVSNLVVHIREFGKSKGK